MYTHIDSLFPCERPRAMGATGIYIRILLAELQLKSRHPVNAYLAFDAEATAPAIVYAAKLEGSAGRLQRPRGCKSPLIPSRR